MYFYCYVLYFVGSGEYRVLRCIVVLIACCYLWVCFFLCRNIVYVLCIFLIQSYIFLKISKWVLKHLFLFLMRCRSDGSVAWVWMQDICCLSTLSLLLAVEGLLLLRNNLMFVCMFCWIKCVYVCACKHFFIWISIFFDDGSLIIPSVSNKLIIPFNFFNHC